MTNRLFIFGYGYTARALVKTLDADGRWTFAGTTRAAEKAGRIADDNVEPVIWNGDFQASWLDGAPHILVSTPPGETGCPALNAAAGALADRASDIQWIGYLSTNGIYGDHDGAWVDETSALRGVSTRARRRIDAEATWRAFAGRTNIPVVIFRLPGIYGPGRSAIDAVRAGNAIRIYKEAQVFSRMHVADIAAAIAASMANPRAGDLFNLADDKPAPPQDVIKYACELLGVDPPPLIPIESAELSDMAKSFYADNKRVSNERMKDALNISPKHASYREGLKAIFEAQSSGL